MNESPAGVQAGHLWLQTEVKDTKYAAEARGKK